MFQLVDNRKLKKELILEVGDLVITEENVYRCNRVSDKLILVHLDNKCVWSDPFKESEKAQVLAELENLCGGIEIIKESDYKMTIELKGDK